MVNRGYAREADRATLECARTQLRELVGDDAAICFDRGVCRGWPALARAGVSPFTYRAII
jgi:hypothetical protein